MTESAAQRVAAALAEPASARWFRAPGRVNLIGEHTDYNDGFVLPIAIDRDCVAACLPSSTIGVRSLELGAVELPADGGHGAAELPAWARLVETVAQELAARGRPAVGVQAVVATDVPIGSGLSSSAAFEVALAVALAAVAGWEVGGAELALACRAAEERALGVPCGVMDQLAAVAGEQGAAVLIDCRSLETTAVALPPELGVLVVHSGQPRALAGSAYADRRRACEELAERLGVPALRDATPEQVESDPLGRHVVGENRRVLDAVDALHAGDLESLGRLLSASHASLRDDFRVSTAELDALVDALVECGALGARLTGGGFGGSVVAVCAADAVPGLAHRASAVYRERTGLTATSFACRAVDGAGEFEPGALAGL